MIYLQASVCLYHAKTMARVKIWLSTHLVIMILTLVLADVESLFEVCHVSVTMIVHVSLLTVAKIFPHSVVPMPLAMYVNV